MKDYTLISYDEYHKVADLFLEKLNELRDDRPFGAHYNEIFKLLGFDDSSLSDQMLTVDMMTDHGLIKTSTASRHGKSDGYKLITKGGITFIQLGGYRKLFEELAAEKIKGDRNDSFEIISKFLKLGANISTITTTFKI